MKTSVKSRTWCNTYIDVKHLVQDTVHIDMQDTAWIHTLDTTRFFTQELIKISLWEATRIATKEIK